jgi:hypothetical protein
MKTKKIGVFAALTVALLVLAALIASCVDALGPGGLAVVQKDRKTWITPTKSAIGFVIEVEAFGSARYSGPDKSMFEDIDDFGKIDVFISGGDSLSYDGTNWNKSPIIVGESPETPPSSGTFVPYIVQVIGYNDEDVPVAFGKDTNVVVGESGGTATISLKEIKAGDHTTTTDALLAGTLVVSPNNTTLQATTLTAKLTTLNGGTNTHATAVSALTAVTWDDLIPGFYLLELEVGKAGHQTAYYRDLIEIWSGMTTTYSQTLDLLSNVHAVVYNFEDGRTPLTVSVNYDHASFLENHNGTNKGTANPIHTTNALIPFKGWYTTASAGTQLVPPRDSGNTTGGESTYKVLKGQSVFAQWQVSGITISLSFDYSSTGALPVSFTVKNNADDSSISSTGITFTQETPLDINIEVSVPTGTAPLTVTGWYYNHQSASLGNGTDIDVDFDADIFMLLGDHEFRVFGFDDEGKAFDGTITITMEP